VVVGSFGHVSTNRCLDTLIEAWHRIRDDIVGANLLIAGTGAAALSQHRHDDETIILIDHIESHRDFDDLLSTVDIGVLLRHPTLGETSGVAAKLLASGTPIIASTASILPTWAPASLVTLLPNTFCPTADLAHALVAHLTSGRRRRSPTHAPMSADHSPWLETVVTVL
jgi:glycosyltransferase involved in cell wall biosynthesis